MNSEWADPRGLAIGARVACGILALRRNQHKSPDTLREIQLRRLRALLEHAGAHVPYYQRVFAAAGFEPRDLTSVEDLRALPVTTKADVRDHPGDFISTAFPPSGLRSSYTSGSTGIPLQVFRDARARASSIALKAYAFMECGARLTDRIVTVAQSDGSLWPRHTIIHPSSSTDRIVEELRKVRPDVLYTYPTFITRLAQFDLAGIRPRLIFSQGLTLTDHCRTVSRSLFGVEPLDSYGSVEFSRLAFECPEHSGLHIITDGSVVEFLEDGKPVPNGKPGQVVVTGLYNYAMPLIRYGLDDLAIPSGETCRCGRSWPLIRSIEGRTMDYLTMPSGRKVFPGFIYYVINNEAKRSDQSIAQFQVVQQERGRIRLVVVQGARFDAAIVARIQEQMESHFLDQGEKVAVDVRVVPEIAPDASGKTKLVVSTAT